MDYGRFLSRSWSLTRRYKSLWFWGLLAVLGTGGGGASRILFNLFLNPNLANPESWTERYAEALTTPELYLSQMSVTLIGVTLLLFLLLIAGWLLYAWAEGALIEGVLADRQAEPVTPMTTARRGGRLLGRFVAIDAVVFFPLFLLLLIMILLGGGSLIGGMMAGIRRESMTALLTPMALGGLCLVPLLCLVGPIGVLTTVFRGLAFRDTAVYESGVWDTIRHTWRVVQAHWGPLLAITGLLWGMRVLAGMLISMVNLPLSILMVPLNAAVPWLAYLLVGSAALPVLLFEVALHVFTAVAWTEAYLMIIGYNSAP